MTAQPLFSQQYNIRGFVSDEKTGEAISSQKVTLLTTDSSLVAGAVTDQNGLFSIPKLAAGNYLLRIQISGYKKTIISVQLQGEKKIVDVAIALPPTERAFEEVTVTGESKTKKTKPDVGIIKFDQKGIERIPVYGAESDVLGAVSVTPGVTTTGDQGGQFYIRGGTPIQNKTLLDGMTIYNPFHSIGFFSIFETELIKSVDIYTGGFESKYGGRISSIMDISYRDGDRGSFGGKVSLSPFLAKLVLEGPLSKAKKGKLSPGSYIFTAKHSLLDYTSKSLYPRVNDGNGLPFNFTDLYGKITFTGDGGSKVSVFGFHNQDSVNYQVADLNWQASGGGLNFLLVPTGSPVFIRGHVNGSNFQTTFNEAQVQPRSSKIGGFDLGFDFSYFLKNEGEMNYGFNFSGFNTAFVTYNEAQRKIELYNFNTEIGAYYNYRRVSKNLRWVMQAGFRVQAYASMSTISPEPRLGLKFNASDKLRLKFSGGRYSQNFTSASSDKDIVNLFNGLLSAPTNVQEEFVNEYGVTKKIKNGLQYAWHGILGLEYDLNKNNFINVEGYYKYFS
ncbi:MAG: TonB-dependent receptor, partial [Flavobacteriia bacterium]|nr:TonB-dependent receptor [Flavobacteriia bacterium]